ncbi:hypothetical protein CCR75_001230 [Bremia lactucae]|uniref:Neurochondrin n=1 Tax=Bremia lactucae TaxID=4779 RepID=A0A976FPM3_BRELC|nr:hypothetical protein CCR75_001230 [Bremia lactucae]
MAAAVVAESNEKIARCMDMLAGHTDEHKFAGLLMVTKMGDLPTDLLQQVRRQVLTTVGVSFFLRLLHTKGPDDVETLSSFQSLGLNLIASFCTDLNLARSFAQKNFVRFLLEQLATPSTPHESSVDCVCILSCLVKTDEGIQVIMQESVFGEILRVSKLMSASAIYQDPAAERNLSEQNYATKSLVKEFWSMVSEIASISELWSNISSHDFDIICTSFSIVRRDVAVPVLAVLNSYMKLVAAGEAPVEFLSSQCLSDIRTGILRFLRAKWPHQERDECLLLNFQLLKQLGMSWMVSGTTLRNLVPPDEVCDKKFILILLKLVSIEIKIMLDEVEYSLIQYDEIAIKLVEETERRNKEIQRVLAVLPICFGIVEMIISALVSDQESVSALPFDILLEVKDIFNQIFLVILELLTLVRDYVLTHRYRELRESGAESIRYLDAVICASIRVASAWIAEDSDTSVNIVMELVPFMVCYKSLHPLVTGHGSLPFQSKRNHNVDSDDDIDSDDEIDAVKKTKHQAAVINEADSSIDQLHFLLPGLLQLSARPDGASIMSENVEVLKRIMHFCCTTSVSIAYGNTEFANVSTLTLSLGILINLIMTRGNHEDIGASESSDVPNPCEWFRALTFLMPVACASGGRLMHDKNLMLEHRGEDDRYVMLLHVVCLVLYIVSHFQDKKHHPCSLPAAVANLVSPFNDIVSWIISHPPDENIESTVGLFELMRMLSMRLIFTPELLAR